MNEQDITNITVLDKDGRPCGTIFRTESALQTGEPRKFTWRYSVSSNLRPSYTAKELREIADILDRRNNPAQKEGEVKGYE